MYLQKDHDFGFDPANLPLPGELYTSLTTAGEREFIAKIPGAVARAPEAIGGVVGRTASAVVTPLAWFLIPVLLVTGLGLMAYTKTMSRRIV